MLSATRRSQYEPGLSLNGVGTKGGVQGGWRGERAEIARSGVPGRILHDSRIFCLLYSDTFPEHRTQPATSPAEHRSTRNPNKPGGSTVPAPECLFVLLLSARDPQLPDVCGVGRVAGFAHEMAWLTRHPIRITGHVRAAGYYDLELSHSRRLPAANRRDGSIVNGLGVTRRLATQYIPCSEDRITYFQVVGADGEGLLGSRAGPAWLCLFPGSFSPLVALIMSHTDLNRSPVSNKKRALRSSSRTGGGQASQASSAMSAHRENDPCDWRRVAWACGHTALGGGSWLAPHGGMGDRSIQSSRVLHRDAGIAREKTRLTPPTCR